MQIVAVIRSVDVLIFYSGRDADDDAVGMEIMLNRLEHESIVFDIVHFKTVDVQSDV